MQEFYERLINETNLLVKSLTLPIIFGILYKVGKFTHNKIRTYKTERSLFPYYTNKIIEAAQRKYIRTKCQNIDPANEISLTQSFAFATKEDLLRFFLRKVFRIKENENRFYLILADSGMGKTTFSINLFIRYKSIFYFNLHKKKIKLLPLAENFDTTVDNIRTIESPNKTILILDGFDELPAIDNESIMPRFNELIELVRDFSIVLISCRTHFFSSEADEPFELKIRKYNTNGNGFHTIKKIYISPFDDRDIKQYINKTFPFYDLQDKRKSFEIVRKTTDLMARPMLLSYIKDIIALNEAYIKNSFDIYEALIYNWINREANRYPQDEQLEFKLNLVYFSYAIADFIYENYDKNGLYIPIKEAIKISNEFRINLNDIEIKSRSLLNRNSRGDYKFSHKSIYEFFLAYRGYTQRSIIIEGCKIKYNLENYNVAKNFIEEIVSSGRAKFLLPSFNNQFEKFNVGLYQSILSKRNENKKITWISGDIFTIS